MAYRTSKILIERGLYNSKQDMQEKLDVFYVVGRLTQAEYEELTALLNG